MPSCYKLCVVIDAVHSLCILKNFDCWSLVGVLDTLDIDLTQLHKQNSESRSVLVRQEPKVLRFMESLFGNRELIEQGRQAGELLDDIHSLNYPTREEIVEVFFQLGIRPLVGLCAKKIVPCARSGSPAKMQPSSYNLEEYW